MRETFKEYNELNETELEVLWNDSIFIFDTNVLLNFYRYSNETADKIIEILEKLNSRLWLPYQVGLEFHKNRLSVLSDQKKIYEDFGKKINDLIEEAENLNRNPFFSEKVMGILSNLKHKIFIEINERVTYYEEFITSKDQLFEKIKDIFEGKVGNSLDGDELKNVFIEGEKRYKDKIPPGYKDIIKSNNDKFGDLIIWKEIIKKSKTDKSNIIFILDDRKEDWWLEHQGKTISPRPELLREFRTQTHKDIHLYKPFQFLKFSNEYLNSKVSEKIIEEVKNNKPQNINIFEGDNHHVLELLLKGKSLDIESLLSELKEVGYHIVSEEKTNGLYTIKVVLPKIPDLERRFRNKYLLNLEKYNIELLNASGS